VGLRTRYSHSSTDETRACFAFDVVTKIATCSSIRPQPLLHLSCDNTVFDGIKKVAVLNAALRFVIRQDLSTDEIDLL
jgi:hypothetical protein